MDKQAVLSKYAKKFAAKSGSNRPMLEGIHYSAGGSAFASNGHYALHIKNIHQFDKPTTIDAKSGMPLDGIYPDFTRLFPSSFKNEIHIGSASVKEVLMRVSCAMDVAKRLCKSSPIVKMVTKNGVVYLSSNDADKRVNLEIFLGNAIKLDTTILALNAEYLHTAVSLFADANRDIAIKLNGPMSPIILTDIEDIEIILLPYRIVN